VRTDGSCPFVVALAVRTADPTSLEVAFYVHDLMQYSAEAELLIGEGVESNVVLDTD